VEFIFLQRTNILLLKVSYALQYDLRYYYSWD